MARIRSLKPDFFKDEDIAELPYEARLFYAGLWCYADKEGRLRDRPERLKVEIFPYDKDLDVERLLIKLSQPKKFGRLPFILRYEVEGDRLIQILSWKDHQSPHHTEHPSSLPPPPADALTVKQPLNNGYTPGRIGSDIGSDIGSGSDTSKDPVLALAGSPTGVSPEDFIALWNNYADKKGLSRIKSLTGSRRQKLRKRLSEKTFTDNIDKIFEKISASAFLLGEGSSRGWKISLDFLIRNEENYVKILEGNYDGKRGTIDKAKEDIERIRRGEL